MGGGNGKEEVGLPPYDPLGRTCCFYLVAMGTTGKPPLAHCSWPQTPHEWVHRIQDKTQPGQLQTTFGAGAIRWPGRLRWMGSCKKLR